MSGPSLFSSQQEAQRHAVMHEVYGDFTRRILVEAGIREGMRVLDLGCGAGLVSFVLASLVGAAGEVIGVEKDPKLIGLAQDRAVANSISNVRFLRADLDEAGPAVDGHFDCIVERLVLFALADPAQTVRQMARQLVPGGVLIMLEFDNRLVESGYRSWPACPTVEKLAALWQKAARTSKIHLDIGGQLFSIATEARLLDPQLRVHLPAGGGPDFIGYRWYETQTRLFEPRYLELGLVEPGELDCETLAERLRDEVVGRQAYLLLPAMMACWARARATYA